MRSILKLLNGQNYSNTVIIYFKLTRFQFIFGRWCQRGRRRNRSQSGTTDEKEESYQYKKILQKSCSQRAD